MSPRIPTGKRPQISRTITSFTIVACLLATAGCAEYVDEETDASGTISTSASASPSASASAKSSVPLTKERPAPTLPDGSPAPLSSTELDNYYAGKFIPPTDKHPVYNMGAPVLSDTVKSRELDGVDALIKYMGETYRYTAYTNTEIENYTKNVYAPDYQYDKSSEKDERTDKSPDGQSKNDNELREAGYWVGEYKYTMKRVADSEKWSDDKKEVTIAVRHKRNTYTWYNKDSGQADNRYYSWGIQEDFNMTLVYVEDQGWKVKKVDSLRSKWLK